MSDQFNSLISICSTIRSSSFVSPSRYTDRPLAEYRTYLGRVREVSAVDFTLHDRRQTFLTLAEGLDIAHYALKRGRPQAERRRNCRLHRRRSGAPLGSSEIKFKYGYRAPRKPMARLISKICNARMASKGTGYWLYVLSGRR